MTSRINELDLYVSNRGEDGQLMDWTKAAGSLTSGIATAAGMRQLRRAENEQFKKSAEQEVEKDLNLTNQTVNNLVVNGAGAGRSKINQLYNDMQNGRISRTQYKAAMANIQSNWKDTAEYIKGVDGKYSEALSRQESGDASEIEMGIIDYFGRLNDLDNKAFSFDDNGAVSVAVFNNEQKPIAYQDIRALNNLMNTKFDKVDLTGMVDVGVKGWEKNKQYSVTDIRLKPELFNAEKQRLTNTILSDNRSVASVLVDHGAHGFYFGDADKERALAQLQQSNPNATEADLVLMEQDKNGYTTAKLTDAQLKKAKDIVGREIEIRFGREVDYAPGYGSGGGGLTANQQAEADKQREDDLSLWRLTYDSFNNVTNTNDMATKLTTASGGKFIFKARKDGGYDVKDESGHVVAGYGKEGDSDYSAPVKNPRDIWRLFKRNDTYWNQIYRESGLEDYNKRVKQFGSKPSSSGGAGTFLNRLTGGSTVDYGSK
jgi:hypothetical protein